MHARSWDRAYGGYAEFYKHAYGQHLTRSDVFANGASLIEAVQSAGDWSDAPTPDLALAWLGSTDAVDMTCDLGAGQFRAAQRTGDAILVAPGAGNSIQMGGLHVCRFAPPTRVGSASPKTRSGCRRTAISACCMPGSSATNG